MKKQEWIHGATCHDYLKPYKSILWLDFMNPLKGEDYDALMYDVGLAVKDTDYVKANVFH